MRARNSAAIAAFTIVVMARASWCAPAPAGRMAAAAWGCNAAAAVRGVEDGSCRSAPAAYPGGMDDYWVAVFWSLLPTVVVSVLFFFILRGIIRADRTERRDYARIEAEERARLRPAAGRHAGAHRRAGRGAPSRSSAGADR